MMLDDTDPDFFIRCTGTLTFPAEDQPPSPILRVTLTRAFVNATLGTFAGPNAERGANMRLWQLAANHDRHEPLLVLVETVLAQGAHFCARHLVTNHSTMGSIRGHILTCLERIPAGRRGLHRLQPEALPLLARLVSGIPNVLHMAEQLAAHAEQRSHREVLCAREAGEADYYAHLSYYLRHGLAPRDALAAASDEAHNQLLYLDGDEAKGLRIGIDGACMESRALLAQLEGGSA
jgi:hypothetical protein